MQCKIFVTNRDESLTDGNKIQSNGIFFRVSTYGSLKTKKKSKSQPLKEFVATYGNVHLRECVTTKFVWEYKWGFVKAVISTAVSLRECPLLESFHCITILKFTNYPISEYNKSSNQ